MTITKTFQGITSTWQDALEPNGPLKKQILEKIRRQLQADPWRWQREMEAEFAEEEEKWKRIVSGYGRIMDGWALMESFKEWILGFSDSVKFLGT